MANNFFKLNLDIVKNFINDDQQKLKYILKNNAFSRNSEMSFKDHIYYMLHNKGRSSALELDYYFEQTKGKWVLPISKQGYSKQRQNIDPEYFKEMNREMNKNQYKINKDSLSKFKDYFCFAVDGTQVGLPNTPITRKEFEVRERGLKRPKTVNARVSILSDLKNGFIIDAQIESLRNGEQTLAYENIKEASKIIPLEKSIIIFDRLYASARLILQLLILKSNFIFRLKENIFTDQRKKMKTDDEYITVDYTEKELIRIRTTEIYEEAKKMHRIPLRIVNIELPTGEKETLLTNLPPEVATPDDLKELYEERWEIEKDYDLLKNKYEIENFTGKKRQTIEQDFHSHIVAFNIVNEEKIYQKSLLKKNKPQIDPNKLNINNNIIIGKVREYLLDMILAKTKEEQDQISSRITFTIQRAYLKTPEITDNTRKEGKNKSKFKITQKRNR